MTDMVKFGRWLKAEELFHEEVRYVKNNPAVPNTQGRAALQTEPPWFCMGRTLRISSLYEKQFEGLTAACLESTL